MLRRLGLSGLLALALLPASGQAQESNPRLDHCGPVEQSFPLQRNGVYPTTIFLCPGNRVRFENQTGRVTALEYFDRNGERAYTSILQRWGDTTGEFTFGTRVELLYRNSDGYWYRTGRRAYIREEEAPLSY